MEFYATYALVKSLHIIFMVTWFAGLFYIVRLYVNQAEAVQKPDPEKSILVAQLKKMQRPLWKGITWPSMILTTTFGIVMFFMNPALIYMPHMHIKLTLVTLLIGYHFYCGALFKKFQADQLTLSSFSLRILNEVASVFLVSIIITIEFAHLLNWKYLVIGLVGFCLLLWFAIVQFKKRREKNQ